MNNELIALTIEEITQEIDKLPAGWQYTKAKEIITKEFKFPDFLSCLDFLNRLAPFCEKIEHHPNIHIAYDRIRFDLNRFDIGGKVTYRDFVVANKIEELYKKRGT